MKEQLSKFQQFFYQIPAIISLLVFILSLIFSLSLWANSEAIGIILLILSMFSLFAMIVKSVADSKIKKLRLGINPLYLVKKFPHKLEAQISELLNQKYLLKEKTGTTAHLEKKPEFSVLSVIVWGLLGFFPAIIYIIWYFTQQNEVVYLDISTQK